MKNIKKIYYIIYIALLFLPFHKTLGANSGIDNPIDVDSVQDLIDKILDAVVQVGTPVAVLFLVYSGFKFITAQGNPGKISEAREFFMWTLIGTAILLGASVLSSIVSGTVSELGAGV